MYKKTTQKSKVNVMFFLFAFSLIVLKSTLGFAQQSPFHADNQEWNKDALCGVCEVANPEFSVDTDPDNYAALNATFGIAGGVWQDLAFPFGGLEGDAVEVEIGIGGGLADFSVLGGLTLESFNGAAANGDGVSLSDLVNIKLVPGTTDRYLVTFVAGADFDRVRVKFAAIATALTNVRVYGARLRYGAPAVSGNIAEPGASANLQLSPVGAGDSIEWFAQTEGGTPIATGLNYTTPALNINTTYYIEITRDGLTEPVRYPVTVGINFPPTEGAWERVYACSQDNLAIGGVQNPELAVDGDPGTHSTFSIIKIGAFYQRLSFADCAVKPGAGDALHIKLGTDGGLLEVLGFVGIQAVRNGVLVGDVVPLVNLASVLNGPEQIEVVFTPSINGTPIDYDGVQITKLSVDSFFTPLNIYEAYFYQPATGPVDVNRPVDVLWGTGGDVASTVNFVRDVANAFDGDDATFAHLRANLSLLSEGVHITALYPTLSVEGDGVRVLLQREEGGLIDASLLSDNIRIRTYNNNDANSELTLDPELIQLSLFPGTTDVYELIYPVNVPFNRIEVSFDAGLASAFEGLHVYELDRAQDVPGGEFPDTGLWATIQDNGTLFGCVACGVLDPENAVDADLTNYSQLNIPISVLGGGAWQELYGFPFRAQQGDHIQVVLGIGSGVIDASLLGGLTFQAMDGDANVGESIGLSNLLSVNLLPGTSDQYAFVFNPDAEFDKVRVEFEALVAALTNIQIYGARIKLPDPDIVSGNVIMPGNSTTVELSPNGGTTLEWFADAEGGDPIATGNSFTTPTLDENITYYIEISRDGFVDPQRFPVKVFATNDTWALAQNWNVFGGCLICNVTDADNAADGDPTTYAILNQTAGIAGGIQMNLFDFPLQGLHGDNIQLVVGLGGGVIDASLFDGLTLQSFNGENANDDLADSAELINLQLLPGSTDQYVLTFTPGADFDRLQLNSSALVDLFSNLRVYGARIQFVKPNIVSGLVTTPGTSTTVVAEPVAETSLAWYDQPEGGTLLASGNQLTTPELNENTTYYVEVSRDGFVEPERYPVTVMVMDAPVAGIPMVRVYADDQTNGGTILLASVANPDNAADGDKDTYSTMNIAVIGEVWQKLDFTTQQPGPDDPVHIKIGTNTGLLNLLSGLTLQAYNNDDPVGEAITLGSLIGLLNGADQADIVMPAPGVPYNSVRIRSVGIALGGGVNIYGAYFNEPGDNVDCDMASDILWGSEASLAGGVNAVDDPQNAIDGDESTFAELHATVSVAGKTHITALYQMVSTSGDSIRVAFQNPGGLLDLGLLSSSLTVRTFLDNQDNGALDLQADILRLSLLPGTSDIQVITYPIDVPFNRIQVSIGEGLATALSALRVYEIGRVAPSPVIAGGSDVTACVGEDVTLEIDFPTENVVYNWYDAETGGNLVGSGNPFTIEADDLELGTNTFYVSLSKNGCTDEASARTEVAVNVVESPEAPQAVSANVWAAPGGSATLQVLDPDENITYNWYDAAADGELLHTGDTFEVADVTADTSYYIEAVAGESCISPARTEVTVTVLMPPVIDPIGATITQGETVTFNGLSPDGTEVVWYDPDGNQVATGPEFTIPDNLLPGDYIYTATTRDPVSGAESDPVEIPVTVEPLVLEAPTVTPPSAVIDEGDTQTFTATHDVPGVTFTWYDPDGNIVATTPEYTTPAGLPVGDYTYTVTATDPGTGVVSPPAEVPVTIQSPGGGLLPPTVNPPSAVIAEGDTETFTASHDNPDVTYTWYDGDGNEVATTPEFTTPDDLPVGDYTYTVTVTDPDSGEVSDPTEVPVTVEPAGTLLPPTVTPPAATIEEGETETFTASHDNPDVTYTWYDPDGNEVATTPEFTTPDDLPVGEHVYTVTVTDPDSGEVSEPTEVVVTVEPATGTLLPPTVTPPSATVMVGDTETFTASHDNPDVTYTWYDPDDNVVATTPEFTIPDDLAVGDYTYTVTVTDPDSGEESAPTEVPVSVVPTGTLLPPTVTPPAATIEEGETETFTATHPDDPDVTYTWYDPDGNEVATTPEFTTPDDLPVGEHVYTVTVTDPDSGEVSEPTEVVVTVEPATGTLLPPTVTPPSATVMVGDTETFTASHDNPDVTYTWYDPDDNVVATTPEFTIPDDLAVGDYTYTVTVTDPDSGEESAPTEVPVSVVPTGTLLPPTVTPPAATIEEGETETFTATHPDDPDVTYTWYDPDGNEVATTPEFTTPDDLPVGEHVYTVTVTDPDSGEVSDPTEVVVTVEPASGELLPPTVEPETATIEQGGAVTYVASTDYPNGEIVWYDDEGNEIAAGEEFTAGPGLPPGTYTYNAVVRDPDTGDESGPTPVTLIVTEPTIPEECLPAYERVYASTQTSSGVSNPGNAVDSNLETFSSIPIPSLFGTNTQTLQFGGTYSPSGGDALHVRVSTDVTLSLLGSVTITAQAYNGSVAVGAPAELSGGVLLNLLAGKNEADIVVPVGSPDPSVSFNAVRVQVSGALLAGGVINIHEAYVNQSVETLAECNIVEDIMTGVTSGALGTLNGVSAEENAVDSDITTAALLRQNVGVAGYVHLTTVYPAPSVPGDSIRVVLADQDAGLLDLGVATGIKIVAYMGNTPVHEVQVQEGLLSLKLLGGGDRWEVATEVDQPFDRVSIQLGGLASALEGVNVYEIERVPGIQLEGNDPGDNIVEACQGGTVNLTAPADDCTTYVWYDARNGGNIIGEGNLEFEVPADWTPGEHIVYVQPVRYGCEESGRIAVTIQVNEAPTADDIALETDNPDYCEEEDVLITATAEEIAAPVFAWYTDQNKENPVADADGVTYVVNNGELSISGLPVGTHTYYVSVKDGEDGCENIAGDLAEVSVIVKPGATAADVQTSDQVICFGETAVLEASSTTITDPVFNWYDNEDLVGDPVFTGPVFEQNGLTAGLFTYYITVQNDDTCESSADEAVAATIAVQHQITADDIELPGDLGQCLGSPVALSAAVNSAITVENPVFTWYLDAAGTQQITNNMVLDGATYTVDGSDMTVEGLAEGTVINYYVSLDGDNVCGSLDGDLATVQVTVGDELEAPEVSGSDVMVCEGEDAVLSILNPQSNLEYNWYETAAGGTPVFTGSDFELTAVTENAVYYVEAVGDGDCVSLTRTEVTVTVKDYASAADIDIDGITEICEYDDLVLTPVTGITEPVFRWYADAGKTEEIVDGVSADGILTLSGLAEGTYTYYVSVESAELCENPAGDLAEVEVTVGAPQAAPVVTPPEQFVVVGDDASPFEVTGLGTGEAVWYSDEEMTAEVFRGTSYVPSTGTVGTFTYYVVIEDGACVSEITQVVLHVTDLPTPPEECYIADSQVNGTTLGCVLCSVQNPTNSIDEDTENFTRLVMPAGLGSGSVYQTLIFSHTGKAGDSVLVDIGTAVGLGDINVLGAITVTLFNGTTQVDQFSLNNPLLEIRLLTGGERGQVLIPATGAYDRVEIRNTAGVATLLQSVDIYGAQILQAAPELDIPDPVEVCEGEEFVVNATPAAGTVLRWYNSDDELLYTGSNFEVPSDVTGEFTYFIEVVDQASGCPSPERIAFDVIVNDGPGAGDIAVTGNEDPVCADDDVVLTPSSAQGTVFKWYMDADKTQPIADGDSDGDVSYAIDAGGVLTISGLDSDSSPYTYYVSVEGANGCENPAGDLAEVSVEITPTVPGDDIVGIEIENTNGDGEVCLNVTPDVVITATLTPGSTVTNPVFHWYDEAGDMVAGGEDGVLTLPGLAPGEHTYSVGVSGDGFCETAEADRKSITFTARDDCQLITAVDDMANTPVDIPVDIDVLANDVPGEAPIDPATVMIIDAPGNGTAEVDPVTGMVTYTPAGAFEGDDTFTYTVKDEDGFESNEATVTVSVGGDNGGLLAVDDTATTPMEMPVIVDVLANDESGNSPIDPTSVAIVDMPTQGTVEVDPATGAVTYTPGAGFEGDDTFTYTMKDEDGYTSNAATVTVSVGGDNGGLLAVDDTATTPMEMPVDIEVLANDQPGNADIDPASVMIVDAPGNGTAEVNMTTGVVTYTPGAGFEGDDTFTYTMKDEDGYTSNAATVTVSVGGDNGGLLAVDDTATTPMEMPVDIEVLANDQPGNADIDPASVMIVDAPGNGTAEVNMTTGVVTYTPGAGFEGDDTFTYTMKDEDGYTSNAATVTVSVGGDNGGLLAVDDTATTPMEMPVVVDVLANDESGNSPIDPTSVAIVDMPTQGTVEVDPATGAVTYTPGAGFEGDDTFTYTMKDEDGYTSNAATVTVSVGGDNGGLLAVDDTATTPMEMPVDIEVLANDQPGNADIDPTSVMIVDVPGNGTAEVNMTTGVVTYTPGAGFEGDDTFTYTMKDEDGYTSNAATVTVSVGGDNGGLLAVDDTATTPMEMPVVVDVLANDEAGNSPIDPTSVAIVDMPTQGTVEVDPATGAVTYTPGAGFEGDDTFTYTMKDEDGYTSNVATVTVSVGGDNGGLLAVDDTATTPMEMPVDIEVLANDQPGNADIDPTSVMIVDAPGNGTAEVNMTTGVVTYTPGAGFEGDDTFTYTMKDEDGYTSNVATVTVSVGGDNGGLLANDDTAVTPMEMPVDIEVLANDQPGNADIDPASVMIMDVPGNGTAEVNMTTGVVTYTPGAGFEGDDTFTYTMKDEDGYTSNAATVTVSVGGDNGGLLAVDDTATTPMEMPVIVDVLANDESGNSPIDPTSVAIVDMPTQGTVEVDPATGAVTYTPGAGFEGDDTFTYTMKDEDGYTSNAATVTVSVGGDNGGLLAVDDTATTPMEMPVDIEVLANDQPGNADIDPASVMIVDAPGNGTAEVNMTTGVVTYTPGAGFEGDDTFTYTMKDEDGYTSNVATVTVSVGGDNGGLLANDDTAVTPMETPVDIEVLANDQPGNADIDPASVMIVDVPGNGTAEVNMTTGVVTYTPGAGFEGDDTFTYTMKDVDGYTSNAATVTVSVGGDNGGLLANDDTAVTAMETPVAIEVLANDQPGNAAIDPASVAIVDMPSDGTVEVAATGIVTYTPDAGFEGVDTFTYTMKDVEGYTSNVATVTVSVGGDNGGLLAVDDTATTPMEMPVDIEVLANDQPGNAAIDPATVMIVDAPGDGTAEVDPATGVVTYTPGAGFEGNDTFTYTMKDVDGYMSNVATVTVSVGGDNGGLLANDDTAVTPIETPVAIEVLANDQPGNANIDPATVAIVDMPSDGTVEVAATGIVTYTPDAGFEGVDTFTYTMKDVDGYTSNIATVTITVGGTNGGLMAVDDTANTIVEVPVTIEVLANDTGGNAPIDETTVAIVDMPADGMVEVNAVTGEVTYTPDTGFEGVDTFTYTVNDTDGYTSNVALVTVTVDPAPTGPIANDDAVQVNPNSFIRIAVLDNDAEGSAPIDPATVDVVRDPSDGSYAINDDGTVDYIPDAGFVGQDSFEYTVEDTEGRLSNVAVVSIDVTSNSDLAITITVDEATPSIDNNVEFTITVTNDGDQVFSDIIVDEPLPSGYEFVRSESAEGAYNELTEKWTIGHIGAEGTATLRVTAKVVAVAGADYLNVVTIEGSSPLDTNPDNNTAQVAVEPLLLVVYNEFSPNGDGFNDTFVIDGIQLYPSNTLQVYNRYGNLVFKTSNYNNDWDGVANKSGAIMEKDRLPVGTYFYVLDTGTGIRKSGWLYLAR